MIVRDLWVRHGRFVALEAVNGRFAPGSLTAVAGPNGAGKSTLLDALAGLARPWRGTIDCQARAENRLAYLPQQAALNLDFPMTVEELTALGLWRRFGAFRALPEPASAQVAAALAAVGLTGLRRRQINQLSIGQRRRAFFARLLLEDAAVLLLDEPFAAVDASTVSVLISMIARWHQEGRTVIAVMHDLDQIRAHFPSTLLLARTAIAWGDTASVLTPDNLALAR